MSSIKLNLISADILAIWVHLKQYRLSADPQQAARTWPSIGIRKYMKPYARTTLTPCRSQGSFHSSSGSYTEWWTKGRDFRLSCLTTADVPAAPIADAHASGKVAPPLKTEIQCHMPSLLHRHFRGGTLRRPAGQVSDSWLCLGQETERSSI